MRSTTARRYGLTTLALDMPSGLHLIFGDESPAGIEQAQAGLPASRFPLSGHQDTGVGKRGLLHLDRPTGRLVPTDGEPTVSPAA